MGGGRKWKENENKKIWNKKGKKNGIEGGKGVKRGKNKQKKNTYGGESKEKDEERKRDWRRWRGNET